MPSGKSHFVKSCFGPGAHMAGKGRSHGLAALLPANSPDRLKLNLAHGQSEWELHAADPGATAFHGWEWLTWVAPLLGCRFVPLVVRQGATVIGLAPMLTHRRLAFRTANIVPFHLGPVVPPEHLSEASTLIRQWARRHGVVSFELAAHPTAGAPMDAFTRAGLTACTDETYLIDLKRTSIEVVWASLGSDARGAVRRSVTRGVSVRASTPDELRHVLPTIHTEVVNGRAGYAARIGAQLAEGEPPFPARCATAVLGDRPVGMSIAIGGPNAAGWLGGVLQDAQATQANAALIWDAVEWAYAQGYDWLDMLGAPNAGIAAYKRKFKPQVLPHPVGTWAAPGVVAAVRVQTRMRSSTTSNRKPTLAGDRSAH